MNKDTSNTSEKNTTAPPATDDVDAIKDDIEETRESLGATVDELSARLDIRKQAKPLALVTAAGVLATVVFVVLAARRRRRRNVPAWRRRR